MTAYVFVGPTLRPGERPDSTDTVYLPPVEQGHVHAILQRGPTAIGIIDGRFHDIPSVWHKEILEALGQGIPVYGSASMGALRAAELADFGMHGVGWVFEAYRSGLIEDDDEVTVAHANHEAGFLQTSDAMVNVRVNLSRALAAGGISRQTHDDLLDTFKAQFYARRNVRLTLDELERSKHSESEILALRKFLVEDRFDQKRQDALKMLEVMREDARTPRRVQPEVFERNAFFVRAENNGVIALADGTFFEIEKILNELRLNPLAYIHLQRAAAARLSPHASRSGSPAGEVAEAIRTLRDLLGVVKDDDWNSWLREARLSWAEVAGMVQEETAFKNFRPYGGALNISILEELRAGPSWIAALDRAVRKYRSLDERGLGDPASSPPHKYTDEKIARWYFQSIGLPVPANFHRYANSLGYAATVHFVRALREEFWFRDAEPAGSHQLVTPADSLRQGDLRRLVAEAVWQTDWNTR